MRTCPSRRRLLLTAAAAATLSLPLAAVAQMRQRTVGFAQDTAGNDWRVAQVRDVRRELASVPGIRFVHSDAGGQMARQIQDIERMAAEVDVLITSPLDAVAMAPVIAAVEARGVPVVLLSRRVQGEAFTCFVHADNHDIGRRAGRFLIERLNGKGAVVVIQHIPTTTPAIGRTEGFQQELAKQPGMTIAAMRRGDSLRAMAIQAMEAILAEGIRFDAIFAQSDSMASGVRLALRQAGIDPGSIPTVGIDYITEAREAILAGQQAASFTYPTFGQEGARLALDLLAGKPVPKIVTVPSTLVTRENAAEVPAIF